MVELFKKYKWFILGYVIYITIVIVCLQDFRHNKFWILLMVLGITVPVASYVVYYLIWYKLLCKSQPPKMFRGEDSSSKLHKKESQMYCRYCGRLIDTDSIFCRYCGKKL